MSNSKARCTACRTYRPRTELTKVGLSSICIDSVECRRILIDRHKAKVQRQLGLKKQRHAKPRVPSRVRKTVRNRDVTCKVCGAPSGRLELHHIAYRSQGGPDTHWNLILLCDECHRLVHSRKRYWQPVLFAYIWLYYIEGQRGLSIRHVERVLKKRGMLPQATSDPDDGRLIA